MSDEVKVSREQLEKHKRMLRHLRLSDQNPKDREAFLVEMSNDIDALLTPPAPERDRWNGVRTILIHYGYHLLDEEWSTVRNGIDDVHAELVEGLEAERDRWKEKAEIAEGAWPYPLDELVKAKRPLPSAREIAEEIASDCNHFLRVAHNHSYPHQDVEMMADRFEKILARVLNQSKGEARESGGESGACEQRQPSPAPSPTPEEIVEEWHESHTVWIHSKYRADLARRIGEAMRHAGDQRVIFHEAVRAHPRYPGGDGREA